jgi:hypothetical protein
MEGSRFGVRKRTLVSYQRDRLNEKGRANRWLPGITHGFCRPGAILGSRLLYRDQTLVTERSKPGLSALLPGCSRPEFV